MPMLVGTLGRNQSGNKRRTYFAAMNVMGAYASANGVPERGSGTSSGSSTRSSRRAPNSWSQLRNRPGSSSMAWALTSSGTTPSGTSRPRDTNRAISSVVSRGPTAGEDMVPS